jgi:hypothetical protein
MHAPPCMNPIPRPHFTSMWARRGGIISVLVLACVGVGTSAHAAHPTTRGDEAAKVVDTSNAPFRAKLVTNAVLVQRAAGSFSSAAKQPAPPKLSADQRKLYAEHTKWLEANATKLSTLHSQMDVVLAKGSKAPATELALMNMQFVTLCEAIELESRRFAELAVAARNRHTVAMSAIRNQK